MVPGSNCEIRDGSQAWGYMPRIPVFLEDETGESPISGFCPHPHQIAKIEDDIGIQYTFQFKYILVEEFWFLFYQCGHSLRK